MTELDIEIFLAIVEKKNLSKAASRLYMSQSTLSHRLNALEAELNAKLFIRHKGHRTLELTPYGNDFISIAERWLALWNETQSLNTLHGSRSFYVGAVSSLIEYLFPDLLNKIFLEQQDKMRLMVKGMPSADLYPALENRSIDLGFSVLPSIYSNVINKPLLNEEEVLVAGSPEATAPGSYGPSIHPQELDPGKEILFHYHPDYMHWRNQWYGYFSTPAIGLGQAHLVEKFFSKSADYWCVLPVSIALAIQRTQKVSIHRFTNPPPPRTCYLLTHRILRSGYESCLDLFQSYLDEFLRQESEAGNIQLLT